MIRYFIVFIFLLTFVFSNTEFKTRQDTLQDIKKIIQDEEAIARAYEQYILDKYALPASINDLYNSSYLGTKANFITDFLTTFDTNFNDFVLTADRLNYALKSVLKNDEDIKKFYENNSLRKKTYYRNDKIYFILEDSFAKHIFNLIKKSGDIFNADNLSLDCPEYGNCKKNDHIYVDVTSVDKVSNSPTKGTPITYLMAYHIEKFKTGPIVITNDKTLQITRDEFSYLSKGTILYDIVGGKYIQTTSGIEALK